MKCLVCGSEVNNSAYCPICGSPVQNSQPQVTTNQQMQSQYNQPQTVYPQYNPQPIPQPYNDQPTTQQALQYNQPSPQPVSQPQFSQPSYYEQHSYLEKKDPPDLPYQPNLGMAWFNFIIYFQLFAAVILSITSAIKFINGDQYGGYKDLFYLRISGLKTLDISMIIFNFVFAAMCIVVRFLLANYKKHSYKIYIYMYIANLVFTLIYTFSIAPIINSSLHSDFSFNDVIDPIIYPSIGVSLLMIICNIIYFNKRKHFFVN